MDFKFLLLSELNLNTYPAASQKTYATTITQPQLEVRMLHVRSIPILTVSLLEYLVCRSNTKTTCNFIILIFVPLT